MNFTDLNNNPMNIEAIKIFKIDELGKEYIIYSIMDNDDSIQVLGILPDDEDIVIAYYNEIKDQLGGSNE